MNTLWNTRSLGSAYIEAESLVAEGDEYRVEGRYRRRGVQTRGLFLVSHGHLDLAAALEGATTDLKVFRAEKWYRERAAAF